MDPDKYDYLFKILLIGDSGVGKSCLMLRYTDDTFTENYLSTIGVDFKIKSYNFNNGKSAKLQIWDTAGQERFRTITTSYYRGAHAIIIAFDPTNRESFINIKTWMAEIERYTSESKIVRFLVSTKCDITPKKNSVNDFVTDAEVMEYIADFESKHSNKLKYIKTSAKYGTNIDKLFEEVAQSLMFVPQCNKNKKPELNVSNPVDINNRGKCCG